MDINSIKNHAKLMATDPSYREGYIMAIASSLDLFDQMEKSEVLHGGNYKTGWREYKRLLSNALANLDTFAANHYQELLDQSGDGPILMEETAVELNKQPLAT